MTVERLRRLYVNGWRFERKYTRDNQLDELVYERGSTRLHVRSPTDATAVIHGRKMSGTLQEMLDRIDEI